MDIFSEILDIKGFKVVNIKTNETEIHFYLENELPAPTCPRCGKKSNEFHQNHKRVVRDLSMSGKACYLHLTQRRFYCSNCGRPFYEDIEFMESGRNYTKRYEKHIFDLVRHNNATFASELEGLTDKVTRGIFTRQAIKLIPKDPFKGVKRVGIDEVSERKGRNSYNLVFYDLDTGKPIEVLETRAKAELSKYLDELPEHIEAQIKEVCIDMWHPYADVVIEKLPNTTLVIDRFHIMKALNRELKELKNKLKKNLPKEAKACHYPLLKNEDNLTENQKEILEKVYEASPKLKQSHKLKEEFRNIFDKQLTIEQGKIELTQWIDKAKKANLFADTIKTIKNWFEPIINYFKQRTTNGPAEGVNNKIKLIKRLAYGFTNFNNFRLRILAAFM